MKKISIYSYAMLCAMITSTALPKAGDVMSGSMAMPISPLKQFEITKNEALMAPNQKADEAQEEIDAMINKAQSLVKGLMTLKTANKSLAQHEVVGRKTEEVVGKQVIGKYKTKLADYRATAVLGDNKAQSSRGTIKHLLDKANERLDDSLKGTKQSLADDKKRHDAAQNAVSQPDAAKPIKVVEEKKEKPAKEPKEKLGKAEKPRKARKPTTY